MLKLSEADESIAPSSSVSEYKNFRISHILISSKRLVHDSGDVYLQSQIDPATFPIHGVPA